MILEHTYSQYNIYQPETYAIKIMIVIVAAVIMVSK